MLDPNPMRCRRFILILIFFLFLWVVVYLPILYQYQNKPNINFMFTQRNLSQFVLPFNHTLLLSPIHPCLTHSGHSTMLAVIVFSSLSNVRARNAIRSTWAATSHTFPEVSVYFLVGRAANGTSAAILEESARMHDIIQEDFVDTYNNLTLKSVMMLKWLESSNCTKVKYVMKTDDDMFVNLGSLVEQLKRNKKEKLLLGCVINNARPVKDLNSKWYTPVSVYGARYYPKYLSGTGYVMSRIVATTLYKVALDTRFFYLEDVFLTGICAEKAEIQRINHPGFKFYKVRNDPCLFREAITAHKMKPEELINIWPKINNKWLKCKRTNQTKKSKKSYPRKTLN